MSGSRMRVEEDGRVSVKLTGDELYPVILEGPRVGENTRAWVRGGSSGQLIELEPIDDPSGRRFEVTWPEEFADEPACLFWSRQQDTDTVLFPPVTLETPLRRPRHASRLTWLRDAEEKLFVVKIMPVDSSEGIHSQFVLTPRCYVGWEQLRPGKEHRALIRTHDGKAFVKHLVELRISPSGNGAGFVSDITDVEGRVSLFQRTAQRGPKTALPDTLLAINSHTDSQFTARRLCRMLYEVLEVKPRIYHSAGAINYEDATKLAVEAASRSWVSPNVRDALSYMALWGPIDAYFSDLHLRDCFLLDWSSVEHTEALLECVRSSAAYFPNTFSAHMLDAIVLSTADRDRAAVAFQAAREANPDMFAELEIDIGASSYLSEAHLLAHRDEIASRKQWLLDSFELHTPMRRGGHGRIMFTCSSDRRFFRIYFPYWLLLAEYFKTFDADFHFLLNGEPDEVARLVEAADGVRDQVARLRAYDRTRFADNVSFSSVPLPPWTTSANSFYASSRFLLARRISDEYEGPLLISDIDFFFRTEPGSFLAALPRDKLGFTWIRGFEALRPWRRFLGGHLLVPNDEAAHACLMSAEDYIIAGLPLERSWTVDQNALSYMVEQAVRAGRRSVMTDIGRIERPTVGERLRTFLEGSQADPGVVW